MRPVGQILFVDFTPLILEQLFNQAAKYEFMSGGQGTVPMVLQSQGGVGKIWLDSIRKVWRHFFTCIPGLKLVMPSNPYDANGLLKSAIRISIR